MSWPGRRHAALDARAHRAEQTGAPACVDPSIEWADKLSLPNGLTCYLTSKRMRPEAYFLAWEIFKAKRYVHAGFELRPDDTVVDVGANIGMFVLWAAPQVRRGRVIAVEPVTSAVACLEANVALNRLDHVTAIPCAIGKAAGTLELVVHPGAEVVAHDATLKLSFFTRLVSGGLGRKGEQMSVPTVSLEQLMDEQRLSVINYLKVDCEGGEYEMLRNIGPSYWPRIERIALEYHELRSDHSRQELVSILQDKGFRVEIRTGWVESLAKCGAIWATRDSWKGQTR